MLSTLSRTICLLLVTTPLIVACDKGPTGSTAAPAVATAAKTTGAPATAATPTALEGQKIGAGVTLADSVAIDAILADPVAFKGKTVRVEGMITDVCPKRGCWMELAGSGPGQKLRFKVTDGEMVFPMDAKGTRAVAQGEVSVRELTLEQSKAHAEYQAKEYGIAYDPASITKPTSIVQIDGTGVVLLAKK
ncbi:MAG: hypothetical protein JWP01_1247 [Myxococcales bacterium]|nr:hypothetical protein [Myxococcales bacterium]